MDDTQDPEPAEVRAVLKQVATYREIREAVRRKSTGTLVFGCVMLFIWYFLDGQQKNWSIFSAIYLSLALVEISVGLLNRIWPAPEGILLDGLVLFVFAASNLIRQYLIWKVGGKFGQNPMLILFGVIWAFQGVQTIRSYFQIRRAMPARPTSEHLRWFDGLVRELKDANPREDALAVAFPTEPFLAGKLLGDTAFFLEPSGTVTIAARQDVQLEREEPEDPSRPPLGYLVIEGVPYAPFKLSDANWGNYVAWKQEGGDDPLARE
jgi:hypothetical protein